MLGQLERGSWVEKWMRVGSKRQFGVGNRIDFIVMMRDVRVRLCTKEIKVSRTGALCR